MYSTYDSANIPAQKWYLSAPGYWLQINVLAQADAIMEQKKLTAISVAHKELYEARFAAPR
jgi:hypothetical protein